MESKKLTISIVNYNAGDYLLRCLASVEQVSSETPLRTIVVDNDSRDDSIERAREKYRDVTFILNKENVGFGKAHNQALKQLDTPYVLFLNPDAELVEGALKYLIDYMDAHSEAGASSCKIEKADGSIDWASHRGFPTPWASFKYYFLNDDSLYHLTNRDMAQTHEVDCIVGAFFLTRKAVLDTVGFFDEAYFMYAEDIDLCLRIKQAGWKVMYIPEVKILHHKGISSGLRAETRNETAALPETRRRAQDAFYESMILFYKKHYEKKYPCLINRLAYSGIRLKWKMARK
ncbi:MAG: glycosyltransferase family 2 protein [Dysgonamonadaceae bacterium]|jgi:GT2 family glycosyltransferase|nr:glycosyltransferase family 2 protein [Dysgonamonadaceae bacterium]